MSLKTDKFEIESDIACKAGIPGNESSDIDLSSLQTKNISNKEEINPQVLDFNDGEIIDRALGIYYKKMGRNDYYSSNDNNDKNDKNIGLFLKYFQDHDYEINDIIDELSGFPDDKNNANAAKNCCYLEFPMFNDFPMFNKKYCDPNKKRIDQFNTLKYCWQYGVPPSPSPNIVLLINGYFRENKIYLTKIIEQEILLFLPEKVVINWQKNIIYKERIRKILDHYSNWDLMEKISCIIPNFLWLGDDESASNIDILKQYGIYYILNCAGNDVNVNYSSEFNVHILYADDADEYNIIRDDISTCIEFINKCINNNGKILIHCLAGMNRSATITIASLMYFKNMDLMYAIKWTQTRRGWILSNESFQQQLINYALKLDLLIE